MNEHFNFWEQMKLHTGNQQNELMQKGESKHQTPVTLSSITENGLSIQFIPSKRKKTRKITMVIEGDFSINNVNKVFKYNDYLMENYDHLDIQMKNIEKMDLCAIQCLYKMRILYTDNKKAITLESELPNDLRELVNGTGLLSLITKPSLTA